MSDSTGIQWTDATWNPTRGCAKDSAECDNCYAMAVAHRFSGPGKPYHGLTRVIGGRGQWNGKGLAVPAVLEQPLRWREPRMIFVNSMSDLFFDAFSDDYIDSVFAVMALATRHTFQVLTKRAERMRAYMADPDRRERVARWARVIEAERMGELVEQLDDADSCSEGWCPTWPLPNAWLGVSTGTPKSKAEKVPHLRETIGAVRFLSCEPLLEDLGTLDLTGIHWVIVGGESGHHARPCALEWIWNVVQQCEAAKVPCFVKQLGARPTRDGAPYPLDFDAKGGDPLEWPYDLRVRQFPEGA